jgi:hypothetical protein
VADFRVVSILRFFILISQVTSGPFGAILKSLSQSESGVARGYALIGGHG